MNKYFIILLCVVIMIAGIFIFNRSISESQLSVDLSPIENSVVPVDQQVFERSALGMDYNEMPEGENSKRNMEAYYKLRAYPGAPPIIPHALESKAGIGGKSCLKCHENGGWVEKFEAYAPVTPHPEFANCRQCHVPKNTQEFFKEGTNWHKIEAPAKNQKELVSSPNKIPHSLQLRENCLACHAGPAAPKEIKTDHPERVNCRQCHTPNEAKIEHEPNVFSRPVK